MATVDKVAPSASSANRDALQHASRTKWAEAEGGSAGGKHSAPTKKDHQGNASVINEQR